MTQLDPQANDSQNCGNVPAITDAERRQILSRRTGDIVKAVRGKDAESWWDEQHDSLNGRTPREVLMICDVSESAVLLMNAAMGTARKAEGFQLV